MKARAARRDVTDANTEFAPSVVSVVPSAGVVVVFVVVVVVVEDVSDGA